MSAEGQVKTVTSLTWSTDSIGIKTFFLTLTLGDDYRFGGALQLYKWPEAIFLPQMKDLEHLLLKAGKKISRCAAKVLLLKTMITFSQDYVSF